MVGLPDVKTATDGDLVPAARPRKGSLNASLALRRASRIAYRAQTSAHLDFSWLARIQRAVAKPSFPRQLAPNLCPNEKTVRGSL